MTQLWLRTYWQRSRFLWVTIAAINLLFGVSCKPSPDQPYSAHGRVPTSGEMHQIEPRGPTG